MPEIMIVNTVLVPVADQDAAIAWYGTRLGCTLTADMPFGEGSRWVTVTPPGGGASLALVPPQGEFAPGRSTGISFSSPDPRALYEELRAAGVDADEPVGGDGTVPVLFFFRDGDGNQLMVAEHR